MRSISFLLAACAFACSAPSFAQTPHRVTLESATVFLSGAELSSTAKLSLPAGETDVLFTNVAGNVNPQSLTIGATGGVVVQSATFQNNYLSPADSLLSPRAKALKDSLEGVADELTALSAKKSVVEEQIRLIDENGNMHGANTGVNVTELQKMMDLVAARLEKLKVDDALLAKRMAKVRERQTRLGQQFEEERRRGHQPGGQLLVKFYAPRAASTEIAMTYVVPTAGWSPSYDLRVESIKDPVKLFYKAQVFQNSGIAWKGVKLTLSSGNPTEGAEAPTLSPWYLAFNNPNYVQAQAAGGGRANEIQLNRGQTVGDVRTRRYERPLLEERNVGSRSILTSEEIEHSSVNTYTSVDAAGIATTFDIELLYDIPSDGQRHNIAVKTYELPATYRYIAVPKLDKDAFLQAQITNWEELNLLPAQTNVFYEGSYVGQGFIDMRNVRDTMNLSLGRDKKIIVRRERDRLYRSDKLVGTNLREAFTYVTTVRNTKREPVTITVLEQFPVSNDKDIEIEDREATDAVVDETTGAVRWTITLAPSETRKLRLAYTVKHPKDRPLAVR